MSKIKVQYDLSGIEGLCLVTPKFYEDNRGCLFEAYNRNEFFLEGLTADFLQDNQAISKKGVLRGFGVNFKHPQAKLVRVLTGSIYDVVIDLRKRSKTFMKWFEVKLSSENAQQLYIPEGFAHAYLALEESCVLFKVSTNYVPGEEIGFAWNSAAFNINWPRDSVAKFVLSDIDKNNPEFSVTMVR